MPLPPLPVISQSVMRRFAAAAGNAPARAVLGSGMPPPSSIEAGQRRCRRRRVLSNSDGPPVNTSRVAPRTPISCAPDGRRQQAGAIDAGRQRQRHARSAPRRRSRAAARGSDRRGCPAARRTGWRRGRALRGQRRGARRRRMAQGGRLRRQPALRNRWRRSIVHGAAPVQGLRHEVAQNRRLARRRDRVTRVATWRVGLTARAWLATTVRWFPCGLRWPQPATAGRV